LIILLDVLPLVDALRGLAGCLMVISMLLLQMALDVSGSHAVLALAANDNSQAGDLLK
jgi:hypothetical protein